MSEEIFILPEEQVLDSVKDIIMKYEEGNQSCLWAASTLHKIQKSLEQSVEMIKQWKHQNLEVIAEESKDFPDGYGGYTFEVRNGGRSYDYSQIPAYQEKLAELKAIEQQHKEAFIAKEKGLMVASEDGEELVLPTIKHRKSSLVLKVAR